MYDVHVRGKCQFLVTRRGSPIPADLASGWKKKRAVRYVSDEIRKVVVREGFSMHDRRCRCSIRARRPRSTALIVARSSRRSATGPGRVKIPQLGALRRISRPPRF